MKERLLMLLACFFLSMGLVCAQTITVSGTVISAEDNEPIVGASVFVQGTTLGTVTDMDGRYTINNVPANSKILVKSCDAQ